MVGEVLDFNPPHALESEEEYDRAVEEVNALLDRSPMKGSPEARRIRFLTVLIAAYDDEWYQIPDAAPQEVVEFLLDQQGLSRTDLEDALGGRSRVSDFFNQRRALSKGQMFALRDLLGVTLDALAPEREEDRLAAAGGIAQGWRRRKMAAKRAPARKTTAKRRSKGKRKPRRVS